MQSFFRPRVPRIAVLGGIAALAMTLSACGGGGANGFIGGVLNNNAQVRFVNGSPDAGSVDVFIDNQQQFCGTGAAGSSSCSVAYAHATDYLYNAMAGTHSIRIEPAGNDSAPAIYSGSFAVNSGFRYAVALTGEKSPSASGSAIGIQTITEQPFNTPANGASVNFNNASPYVTAQNNGAVQFGYYTTAPSAATTVGSAIGLGAETNPSNGGIPAASLNVPITFYAVSATSGITTTPNAASSAGLCSSNSLPCSTGNLSLYLVDGPAASTSPSGGLPSGVTASSSGVLVGAFDPNGS